MSDLNYVDVGQKLVAAVGDPATRLQLLTEIRDKIEVVFTPEYPKFLAAILPAFFKIFTDEEAQYVQNDAQYNIPGVYFLDCTA
ncbi:hypothetical protein SARC_00505 [Sphaeroforma arctica JP610]|uniref:Uncharacterized protein n=1 Tax=Sphaeroforma arctica JP610 TaxID=667725 RepID=A0A0L0GEQ1_9EUKA|nr:hypothetical protein SARC_00505 [Sphaeroforma arctica JP610]KNC87364.1 hypothetical protein SARC_00505 [Sphaeroforma arctica JP610]|eukprot:XP_014161266.1 hypothetical protein SARC_00505 [Sphaeroforma arctica JP610]